MIHRSFVHTDPANAALVCTLIPNMMHQALLA